MALSVIFSLGAMIGAMITMYAAVATRTGEIGTLRALGFQRASILVAFLVESLLLALLGGVAGLVAASFLTAITVSTTNFQSFSELAFSFTLTPQDRAAGTAFRAADGIRRRLSPGDPRQPHEDRRRAARRLAAPTRCAGRLGFGMLPPDVAPVMLPGARGRSPPEQAVRRPHEPS